MIQNQLKFLKGVIYDLKRDYAFKMDLYRKTETVNLITGKKTVNRTKFKMRKVVMLPSLAFRDFSYGSVIATQGLQGMQTGGLIDVSDTVILIDRRELPRNLIVDINDYIVFNHSKYEIKDITKLDLGDYLRLTIRQVKGEIPNETSEQIVIQYLEMSHKIGSNPEGDIEDFFQISDSIVKTLIHHQRVVNKINMFDGNAFIKF